MFSHEMSSKRLITSYRPSPEPAFLAAFTIPSFASAPLLQKNIFPGPVLLTKAVANSACFGWKNILETCTSSSPCLRITSANLRCACPKQFTAIPLPKSKYSFPSASQTLDPLPRTKTGAVADLLYEGTTCWAYCARTVADSIFGSFFKRR